MSSIPQIAILCRSLARLRSDSSLLIVRCYQLSVRVSVTSDRKGIHLTANPLVSSPRNCIRRLVFRPRTTNPTWTHEVALHDLTSSPPIRRPYIQDETGAYSELWRSPSRDFHTSDYLKTVNNQHQPPTSASRSTLRLIKIVERTFNIHFATHVTSAFDHHTIPWPAWNCRYA